MAEPEINGVEIRYGTPEHASLLSAIRERYRLSERSMSKRHEPWKKAEDLYRAYMPEKKEDTSRRVKREFGEPQFTTVHIPYAYATLLTAHTYWTSVFLSRSPVFQYTARHGEAQAQVQAVEALIDYQVMVGNMLVPLYIWLLDAGKYGLGVIGNYWAEEKSMVTKIVDKPLTVMGIPVPGVSRKVKERTLSTGYVGNRIFNVRPYDFFPDPRVTMANLQDGEFCGRITHVGWNTILKGQSNGDYFNVDNLENFLRSGRVERAVGSSQIDLPWMDASDVPWGTSEFRSKGYVELLEMQIELVPREWKLGASDYPEKWAFTVGQDSVIIGAKPLGLDHNKFGYLVQEYEVSDYGRTSRGMMEVLKPLNDALTWLVNSHIYNVRKGLNDELIVDPSRVVFSDIKDGGPGRIIRLLPEAYSSDVRTAVTQLQVTDVTGSHLRDMMTFVELFSRISGVNDNLMGVVNVGGRKTATEVRTSSSFGINRLKTFSEYNSALGWAPLAQMLLQNTQQLYTSDQAYRIAGDLTTNQAKYVKVTGDDIQGFFDFVPVDGTMPIDRQAQAMFWREILMNIGQVPQLAQAYDIGGIFQWMAQLAGLKNITQFKIQVSPDQQIQQQLQAGNIVPIGAGRGPRASIDGATDGTRGI